MRRVRIATLALAAVMALGAISATAAEAVVGPFFQIETNELKSLETREIKAEAGGEFEIISAALTVKCMTTKLKGGANIEGMPAKTSDRLWGIVFEYGTCKTSNTNCTVTGGAISSKELIGSEGYAEQVGGVGKGKLLTLLQPKTGNVIMTVSLTGPSCPLQGLNPVSRATMSTGVIAEDLETEENSITTTANQTEGEKVHLKFPAGAIASLYVENNGVLTEQKGGIEFAGGVARLSGITRLRLPLKEPWGVFT